jgi:hypothetical protein
MAEFLAFALVMSAAALALVHTAKQLSQPKLKPQPIKVENEQQRRARQQRPF